MTERNEDEAFDDAFADDVKDAPTPETETQEAQPEPQAEPEPEQQEAQETEQEEPEPQPPPQEAKTKVDPEQFKGYLDEREKRQSLERERDELRRQMAQLQQQSQPKEPPPDRYDDPDGYDRYREGQLQQGFEKRMLMQSEFLAQREYGSELVQEAKVWAAQLDDARANALLSQPSPFHAAVEAYQQEQATSELRKYNFDLGKMKEAWLAEQQAAPTSEAAPPSDNPPPKIPPKVANSGGNIGNAPTISEGERFNRFFS